MALPLCARRQAAIGERFNILIANAPAVEMSQPDSRRMRMLTGSREMLATPFFPKCGRE